MYGVSEFIATISDNAIDENRKKRQHQDINEAVCQTKTMKTYFAFKYLTVGKKCHSPFWKIKI